MKSALSFPHPNRAFRRLIWFGAIAAGLLIAAAPAGAADAQQAVESAVGSDQIQRDVPNEPESAERRAAREAEEQARDRARNSVGEVGKDPDIQHDQPAPPPDEVTTPRSMGPIDLSWLPYLILGVIGIALAYVLLRYVGNRYATRKGAAAKAKPLTAASGPERAAAEPERDRTFDEVDALAQSGAFTEAVHRLLLLVQERLRSRIEHGLQASLTSREILRRARLPQEAATSFATLVAAVEVSLFGMRSANAATYALCREQSQRVLAAATESA
jgi:hypothetical protein